MVSVLVRLTGTYLEKRILVAEKPSVRAAFKEFETLRKLRNRLYIFGPVLGDSHIFLRCRVGWCGQ